MRVRTTLPAGLLGMIPTVALCAEAQANAGTCPAASEIGSASVSAGAGSEPYAFTGKVYLTGPYDGAPYGLSIVVPAIAGPFDFGKVVTRARSASVCTAGARSSPPRCRRIVQGVPLRLREHRRGRQPSQIPVQPHQLRPRSRPNRCSAASSPGRARLTEQSVSSPFQVGECGKLAFTPKLTASTGARSLAGQRREPRSQGHAGAGTQPAGRQANIREVLASLPKKLAARITTLHKACPAATFEAAHRPAVAAKKRAWAAPPRPRRCCPKRGHALGAGRLGRAGAPDARSTGPAYLVSHGGEAYPGPRRDPQRRQRGAGGAGRPHPHLQPGILSSSFESLPDVPISSFALSIPTARTRC